MEVELSLLLLEVERLEDLRSEQLKIRNFANDLMEAECATELQEFRELHDRLEALKREKEAMMADAFTTASERVNKKYGEKKEVPPEPAPAISMKIVKLCAKLFKKIAAKTHPDKTSDPLLHEIFRTADLYRSKGHLQGLEMLWEAVKGSSEDFVNPAARKARIVEAVKTIQEQVEEKRALIEQKQERKQELLQSIEQIANSAEFAESIRLHTAPESVRAALVETNRSVLSARNESMRHMIEAQAQIVDTMKSMFV